MTVQSHSARRFAGNGDAGSLRPDAARAAGRRERRKTVTRHELLRAGQRLFGEKGLYESRVEEITERADIGKGTLYRYFRSKEDLILAVVTSGLEGLRDGVARRTALAADLEGVIEGVVTAHVEFFDNHRDLVRILHQVRGMLKFDRREWRPLRKALEGHIEFLARELARFLDPTMTEAASHRELAGLLHGAVSGAVSVRVALEPQAPLRPMAPALATALVHLGRAYAGRSADHPRRAASAPGRRRR